MTHTNDEIEEIKNLKQAASERAANALNPHRRKGLPRKPLPGTLMMMAKVRSQNRKSLLTSSPTR